MKNILRISFLLLTITLLFASFTLGGWISDRSPPGAYIGDDPTIISEGMVKPGSVIIVKYIVFRNKLCPLRVDRSIVDSFGVRYSLPSYELAAAGDLGMHTLKVKITLPADIEKGVAEYKVYVSYFCNPIHSIWPIVVEAPPASILIN